MPLAAMHPAGSPILAGQSSASVVYAASQPEGKPTFDADLGNRSDAEGDVISFSAAATDPNSDPLTYEAQNLPFGVSINASSGLISGTLGVGAAAGSPYDVLVTVRDGLAIDDVDTFTWTVTNTPAQETYLDMILARTGVVAAYMFGDDTNPTMTDRATGHNGVYTGDPTHAAVSPITNDTELATTFETADYATITDHADFDFGNGPFSIEFWTDAGLTTHTLIDKSDGAGGYEVVSTGSLPRLRNGASGSNVRLSTAPSSGWHHYVFTRGTGVSGTAYLDGVENVVVATQTFSDTVQDILIQTDGSMYGLVFYDRVVTVAEALESASFVYGDIGPAPSAEYEGYGALATGGEGQAVYRITSLANTGAGTLRDALSQGNRSIVFDVGGTITLTSAVAIGGDNITLDGATAPSPGITIVGSPITANTRANLIIKDLRFHDATVSGSTGDALTFKLSCHNVIVDHCSFEGATDGQLDITRTCYDFSVQWCIIGPGVGVSKMSLVGTGTDRVTYHHNLIYGGATRQPQAQFNDADHVGAPDECVTDVRCNVVWAPSDGQYGSAWNVNAIGNCVRNYYYLASTGSNVAIHTETGGSVYASGNYSRNGGSLTGFTSRAEMSIPAYAVVTMEATAQLAAAEVIAGVGCRVGGLDASDTAKIAAINAEGL